MVGAVMSTGGGFFCNDIALRLGAEVVRGWSANSRKNGRRPFGATYGYCATSDQCKGHREIDSST